MKIRNLVFALFIFVTSASAQNVEPYTRAAGWEKEIATFEEIDRKQTPPENAILFTGSSSIRMWTTLGKDFPSIKFINRGFGGSHFEDLVYFAPRIVLPYKPKLIVVYSGENDIEVGQTAENVLADFKAFVELRDKNLPRTPIVYISMKPSVLRWSKWPEMKRGNDLIRAEISKHKHIRFADLASKMLGPDGKPLSDIFLADNLHMNAKGYAIWREHLAPFLK
jgi:lysophospholipase L1-like esterase